VVPKGIMPAAVEVGAADLLIICKGCMDVLHMVVCSAVDWARICVMHIIMLVTGMLQIVLLWTAAPTAAGAVRRCLQKQRYRERMLTCY
jgi:hypothetical protein